MHSSQWQPAGHTAKLLVKCVKYTKINVRINFARVSTRNGKKQIQEIETGAGFRINPQMSMICIFSELIQQYLLVTLVLHRYHLVEKLACFIKIGPESQDLFNFFLSCVYIPLS